MIEQSDRVKPTLLLVLMLAGCARQPTQLDAICSTPQPLSVTASSSQAAESCVHRWAYRLAAAPSPAPEIAKAVVAGCDSAISADAGDSYRATPEALRGDEDAWYRRHLDQALGQALFHVIQARAGHCRIP